MQALGVYIFAGAFTQGMRAHAEVVAHLEDKPYPGTDSSLLNFPDVPIYFRTGGKRWPVEQFRGIDLVYCNPPCAIFSPIGVSVTRGNQAWRDDVRLNCWLRCAELMDTVQPKMLVIESVPQALTRGREMVDSIARHALDLGYSVTYLEVDAGVHGTPQHRKRFFFVAHKHKLQLRPVNWGPVATVGETLAEVGLNKGWTLKLREDLGEVYPRMKLRANGSWESIRVAWCRERGLATDAKNVPGMPMFMLHRLTADRPAGAFCGNYWLHPDEPRHLGIQELKALCGYPLDFKLSGREHLWPTLLAQAVLPPVGEWVGASAARTLELGVLEPTPRVWRRNTRTTETWDVNADITDEIRTRTEFIDITPRLEPEKPPHVPRGPRVGGVIVDRRGWLDREIELVRVENPRRPGSETFRIYGYYESGIKVRDFIDRGGRIVDVKHDLERGHIRLVEFPAAPPN